MYYQTTIVSVGVGDAVNTEGKRLRFVGNLPCVAGDVVWTDGTVIFGHVKPRSSPLLVDDPKGIPILGETDDDTLRGYVNRHGRYKKYSIAEGDLVVNGAKRYYHDNGNYLLDAEIALVDDKEVGHYTAKTTTEQPYEAILTVDHAASSWGLLEQHANELVISAVKNEGEPNDICRLSLGQFFGNLASDVSLIPTEFDVDGELASKKLQIAIEPDVSVEVNINNLKISSARDIDILASSSAQGDLYLSTNYQLISSGTYTRDAFFEQDFLLEHEEYGGHPKLKRALIALWDYWLAIDPISATRAITVDIDRQADDQIHYFEVKEYRHSSNPDSDTSFCGLANIQFQSCFLDHYNGEFHVSTSNDIASSISPARLFDCDTVIHHSCNFSNYDLYINQIAMSQVIVPHNDSSRVDWTGFVTFNNDSSDTKVYGYVYTYENEYTRYREIPSPVMSVRVLPLLAGKDDERPALDYSAYHPIDQSANTNQDETADYKLAAYYTNHLTIGHVSTSDIANFQVGTCFLFFEGDTYYPATGFCSTNDDLFYKFTIRDTNPANDQYTHEHSVCLCIKGEFAYSSSTAPSSTDTTLANFSFPVQDDFTVKFMHDTVNGSSWLFDGLYQSDTLICDQLPTQFDEQQNEIPVINYNLAATPIGRNAIRGHLIGVHDGGIYKLKDNEFETLGNAMKNFRFREIKNITRARK